MSKRIGIDARFYGSIGKGLGRYTQKLIENLEKEDAENKYFIFLRKENFDEYEPQNKNFHKVLSDFNWYTISEQINMPRLLNKYKLDLVHFPHFNIPILYKGKFVITIHDLILVHFPTLRGTTLNPLWYWFKFLMYKMVIWIAIKKSQKILTVSEFTKKDIVKNYNVSESKIKITYEACEIKEENNQNTDIKKYGIIEPYLLYVGNAYPHKNLERLLLAFKGLHVNFPELKLVLVGKVDYFYDELKNLVVQEHIENIIFPGFIPDNELNEVYKRAELYIFPSLYEGFGLPPLEAMVNGVAVASSDHSCMKEVLGDSALFFDATKIKEIERAIIALIRDKDKREELIKKGYQQIKKYSWEKMAKETLKVYARKFGN